MRYPFIKPTTIINAVLVCGVLAVHAVAFGTIIYSQRYQPITDEGAESLSINIYALNLAGESNTESVETEMAEEIAPEMVEEKKEVTENIISTETVERIEQPAVVKQEVQQEKPKPIEQPKKEIPRPIQEVKKSQKNVATRPVKQNRKNTPVGNYVSKASSRGGSPMLAENQFKFIYNPKPTYPRSAKKRGLSGSAVVLVTFNERGLVSRVKLEKSSGVESLDQAAVSTAKKVKVHPYIQEGRATTFNHKITYDFSTY